MKIALVTTTVNVPTVLSRYRELGPEVDIVVAGDMKTPPEAARLVRELDGTYLSPAQQYSDWPQLSDAIGWNCMQRRNIAILEAARRKPDVIVTIDDDNAPVGDDYFDAIRRSFATTAGHVAEGDWFNLGECAKDNFVARGYPYSVQPNAEVNGARPRTVGVVQGLIFGDPDINATERIEVAPQVNSYSFMALEGIAVDPSKTWTPVNSQNTAWLAELAPLMLLPPEVGRYDDIWGSYIAETVMATTGHHVLFGHPHVRQERNPHNLFKDLRDELYGMEHTDQLIDCLNNVDVPDGTVVERLEAVLHGLFKESALKLPWVFFEEWTKAWQRL